MKHAAKMTWIWVHSSIHTMHHIRSCTQTTEPMAARTRCLPRYTARLGLVMCPVMDLSWLGMQAIGLTLLIFVAWPLLTLPAGIFSRDYFRFWIVLAMIWGTLAGMPSHQ